MSRLTATQLQDLVAAAWDAGEDIGSGQVTQDELRTRILALLGTVLHSDQDALFDLIGDRFRVAAGALLRAEAGLRDFVYRAQTAGAPGEEQLQRVTELPTSEDMLALPPSERARVMATAVTAAQSDVGGYRGGQNYQRLIIQGDAVLKGLTDARVCCHAVLDAARQMAAADLPAFMAAQQARTLTTTALRSSGGAAAIGRLAAAELVVEAGRAVDSLRHKLAVSTPDWVDPVAELLGGALPLRPASPESATISGETVSAPAALPAVLTLCGSRPLVATAAGEHGSVVGNGVSMAFAIVLKERVVPGTFRASIVLNGGAIATITDHGAGVTTSSDGGIGSIDYTTGVATHTFTVPPAAAQALNVSVDFYLLYPGDPYLSFGVYDGTVPRPAAVAAPVSGVGTAADLAALLSATEYAVTASAGCLVLTSVAVGSEAVLSAVQSTEPVLDLRPDVAARWSVAPATILDALGMWGQARGEDVFFGDVSATGFAIDVAGEYGEVVEHTLHHGDLELPCDLDDAAYVEVLSPFYRAFAVTAVVGGVATVTSPAAAAAVQLGFADVDVVLRASSRRLRLTADAVLSVTAAGLGFSGEVAPSSSALSLSAQDSRYRVRPRDVLVVSDAVAAGVDRVENGVAYLDASVTGLPDGKLWSAVGYYHRFAAAEILAALPQLTGAEVSEAVAGTSRGDAVAAALAPLSAAAARAAMWAGVLGATHHAPLKRALASLQDDGLTSAVRMARELRFLELTSFGRALAGDEDGVQSAIAQVLMREPSTDAFIEVARPETDDA